MKKTGRKPQIISGTEKTEYRRNGSEYFQKRLEQAEEEYLLKLQEKNK